MSPFDLRGPEFLLFYLFLGALVLIVLYFSRRFAEPSDPVRADLSDPYLIAFLRGGKNELLRVATISLIHRGLLKFDGGLVSAASPLTVQSVRDPVEHDLLLYFDTPREAASVFTGLLYSSSLDHYTYTLETLGILPNHSMRVNRCFALAGGLVVLWGIAGTKIDIALGRGHTNIGFLIILAIVFAFLAYKLVFVRLTLRGKAMLTSLRLLFAGLKDRPAASFTTNDVSMVAAVFGFAALPLAVFPYAETLYPKATEASRRPWGDSGSSSCGSVSSCGSSGSDGGGGGYGGGDGGGGSCGGGGCGGGCGGCGS